MAGLLSGILPYVYSQSDRLKRNVNGLLSDPRGTLEQTAGGLLDAHRGQQNLLAQAFADPGQPFKMTDPNAMQAAAMNMLAGPLGVAPAGMVVYHGSPAVFDKFSREKIGSGRGLEQGWGVYLTDAERVARENGQNVYKVDVPDEAVSRMLAWQQKLKDQPKPVRKGVLSAVGKDGYKNAVRYGATGSDVYNTSLAHLSQQEASELLRAVGVPGIRYGGNGTTNTVVFDPGLAAILP
jgi:hypothetical protein